MPDLLAVAVRWVDDEPQPGLVEVRFTDADGREWCVIDKAPIFDGTDQLGSDSSYPQLAGIACVICGASGEPAADGIVTVSTSPHGVTATDGQDQFRVRRDQLRP